MGGGPRGPPRRSAPADASDLSSANQMGAFSQEAGFHLQAGDEKRRQPEPSKIHPSLCSGCSITWMKQSLTHSQPCDISHRRLAGSPGSCYNRPVVLGLRQAPAPGTLRGWRGAGWGQKSRHFTAVRGNASTECSGSALAARTSFQRQITS